MSFSDILVLMDSQEFKKQYGLLNPEQKQAVDAIEGPVMVIAGPGTGKTQILSLRIANILRKTDIPPDAILALTFTESATHSMRQRLQKIIGNSAYRVGIFTFHGFCNEVIRNYPDYFPRIIGSVVASEVDRIKIVEDIISKNNFKLLKPFGNPKFYIRPVLSSIQKLKRENFSPKDLEKFIKQDEDSLKNDEKTEVQRLKAERLIEKNKELLSIFRQYEKTLAEKSIYDYEDMILEVIRSLEKNREVLLSLQEEYQYILADEHQDANNAQNRILELLASFHDSPNLFIVGDEKQAIFRFQGASLDNFLYFKKIYPEALILTLKSNYRSTQTILDASHSVILNNPVEDRTLREKLLSQKNENTEERKIVFLEFNKPSLENMFLAEDIKEKIKSGISPRSIAVFYRDNNDAMPIIKSLENLNVPFEVFSDQNLFLDENIRKLILFINSINNFGDDTLFSELLFIDFLGFDSLDIFKLINFSNKKKKSIFDILHSLKSLDLDLSQKEELIEFYKKFRIWSVLAKNRSLVDFLEIIVRESGFLTYLMKQESIWEELNKLEVFFDQAKLLAENHKEARLRDFLNYLDVLKEHNVLVKASYDYGPQKEAVKLMTAHKAKGLEFDYVYITGLSDGHWGMRKRPKHFELPIPLFENSLEDERRLFYVALTRAKKEVCLTFSKEDENKTQKLVSQFVSEIDDKFLFKKPTEEIEKKLSKNISIQRNVKKQNSTKKEKDYLRELFFERGLSVTALNNFLDCPWKYFFENLLRIPKAPTKSQLYGIAVHHALEELFIKKKKGDRVGREDLLLSFSLSLKKQPLSQEDFEDSLEKGRNSLGSFFDFYKDEWNDNFLVEFKINGIILDNLKIGDKEYPLILTGKLDKVEITEGSKVNVVDYKTSQPKSKNEILGNTKNSNGDIYRQLLFYKVLLDRFDKGKFNMISGEIDFVEPDKKGRFKKEKFFVSQEETDDLVNTIKQTAKKIANFSFWNEFCDKSDCHYCTLRKSMNN